MSISDDMLTFLHSLPKRGGISGAEIILAFVHKYKRQSVKNAYTRLKQRKLVAYESGMVVVSPRGKAYIQTRKVLLPKFSSHFSKADKKNLIVMFDIPQERKAEREWFRRQLREFGFEMIQKSVWFGPSPLPREFVRYIRSIKLEGAVKVCKVSNITSL